MNNTVSNGIHPLQKIQIANLSGYSKRKLQRRNTVHLRGKCPKCGEYGMKFVKDIPLVSGKYDHNKWVCKKCGNKATRKDLEYVKYV